jgi:glycoside/pentoside/hexuronide:cation symporter, GPH family
MLAYSKLRKLHKGLYALPAFVLALPTIPVFVLMPSFYAETMGLGLASVGAIFLGLRLLDVISDPLLGYVSDQIPSRFGRRRLPMALGAMIGAPALIMLFSPAPGVSPGYLIGWGAILYLAWTAVQIPYVAWAVELEHDYVARAQLNGYREGAGLLGIMATGAAGILMMSFTEQDRFQVLAWITVFLGCGAFYLTLRFVPDGHFVPSSKSQGLSFPWHNYLFLRVLTAWFLNGLANGLPAVCLPLFMTHILGASDKDQAALLFIYFLFAVIGIPAWVWLSKIYAKHLVWCISMSIACAVFLTVPLLGAGDIYAFGLICALTGLTLGSDLALPPAIQADCADWDCFRFNKERTGTLFAYWSMSTKLALGLAVGIAFPVLSWMGLDDQTQTASYHSKAALVVIYAVIPIVLKIIAIMFMRNFPIGPRQHKAINRRLESRI